ncbi:hypothetical protein DFH06DRAFT_688185 [Mycena polygramma]|nr:hypothetical protein DFH06DRAFT_688185 [Mycena polygramma]
MTRPRLYHHHRQFFPLLVVGVRANWTTFPSRSPQEMTGWCISRSASLARGATNDSLSLLSSMTRVSDPFIDDTVPRRSRPHTPAPFFHDASCTSSTSATCARAADSGHCTSIRRRTIPASPCPLPWPAPAPSISTAPERFVPVAADDVSLLGHDVLPQDADLRAHLSLRPRSTELSTITCAEGPIQRCITSTRID